MGKSVATASNKVQPKKEEKVVAVERKDAFGVFEGEFPRYTSEDVDDCHAFANKLRGDAIHQGRDLRHPEHAISVRALQ